MLILTSVLLLVSALFNVVVWPQFLRRIKADPRSRDEQGNPTKFLTVHVVLISIALVIAALCAVGAVFGFIAAAA